MTHFQGTAKPEQRAPTSRVLTSLNYPQAFPGYPHESSNVIQVGKGHNIRINITSFDIGGRLSIMDLIGDQCTAVQGEWGLPSDTSLSILDAERPKWIQHWDCVQSGCSVCQVRPRGGEQMEDIQKLWKIWMEQWTILLAGVWNGPNLRLPRPWQPVHWCYDISQLAKNM